MYLSHLGRHEEAVAAAEQMFSATDLNTNHALAFARVFALAGGSHRDTAFEMLVKLSAVGSLSVQVLDQPDFAHLRDDPRYQDLKKRWVGPDLR